MGILPEVIFPIDMETQLHLYKTGPQKPVALKKHSAIIQMSHRISAAERKVLNVLLYTARETLKRSPQTFKFSINLAKLKEMSGIQSTENVHLKKSLIKIKETLFVYNILNKDKEIWGTFHILAGIEVNDGIIEYSFPHQLHEKLLNPSVYAILDLNVLKGLQRKHSIVLYELARDYANVSIPYMSIDQFRELMGLSSQQYKNSKDLRKHVIEPAIDELNQKTEFAMTYELSWSGRKVTGIKFDIRRNDNYNREIFRIA